jgi:hypothetical protein
MAPILTDAPADSKVAEAEKADSATTRYAWC